MEEVSRRRGAQAVLDGVSASLAPGSLVGLVGPSGSGKSTLVRILAGLDRPDRGRVLLDGQPVEGETLRSRVGYLPQSDVLHAELSPARALHYAAALRLPHRSAAERAERVERLLAELELTAVRDRPVAQLSGGQRKRTALATELITEPGLILLDEPTANLEPALRRKLWALFRRLADTGHTILVVTHQVDLLGGCDRVLHLAGGRLRDEAGPSEPVRAPEPAAVASGRPRLSAARELALLCARNMELLIASPRRVALLLAQGAVIGGLLALALEAPPQLLFMLVVSCVWLGTSAAASEVVRERAVLVLERRAGLRLTTYLTAKLIVIGGVVALQTELLLLLVHQLRPPPGASGPLFGVLLLTAGVAVCLGLAISTWSRRPERASALVPLVLIPQVLFGGALAQSGAAARAVGWTQPSRWAYDLSLRTALATEPGSLVQAEEQARAAAALERLDREVGATLSVPTPQPAPLELSSLTTLLGEASARRERSARELAPLRASLREIAGEADEIEAAFAAAKARSARAKAAWRRGRARRKRMSRAAWKAAIQRESKRWLSELKAYQALQKRKQALDRRVLRTLRVAGPALERADARARDAGVERALRLQLTELTARHAAALARLGATARETRTRVEERLEEARRTRAALQANVDAGRVIDLPPDRTRRGDALALLLFAGGAFGLGLLGLRLHAEP